MNAGTSIIRLLGVAQLTVFAASMISERLLASVVGTGSIAHILVSVTQNPVRMRVSNLIALLNCVGIVILGVLFYVVFSAQYQVIALAALAFFLAEAITLAVSKIGAYSLIRLGQEYVEAGAPEFSRFQTLGHFLYYGVDRTGYDIHMVFFCLGAMLWYYLLWVSKAVPLAVSAWGLTAVSLLLIPVLIVLFGRRSTPLMLVGLLYAPYELVLGVWLIARGFN